MQLPDLMRLPTSARQVPGGADAGTGTVRPVAEGGAPAPRLLDRVPLRGRGRLRGLHTGMEEEIKERKVVTIIFFLPVLEGGDFTSVW